jgi:hypothetical protein
VKHCLVISALSFALPPKVPPPPPPQPYQRWLYKDPKFPRTKFSKEILPSIHKSAYPVLQGRFENYFYGERSWRFDFIKWKAKIETQIKVSSDEQNLASYAKFANISFKSLSALHMHKCNKWITIMAEFCDNLTEKKEELKHVKSDLYVGNTLKAGMDEKDEFIQTQINQLINMEETCNGFKEKLENKLTEQLRVCV